ncbi:MAG: divalent-cation tolerance protein CutA [Balneolaceae bacterium]|nr:MAG: divalent-cation tolerance protein CutA [Balneolaceae bacterium]
MFRNLRLVYVTTKNREEAIMIGRTLVEEQLVACANILDGMESIYQWEGEVVSGSETVLLLKTAYGNVSRITRRIKELHSYKVPCVISLNLSEQEGNMEYLDWIRNSSHRVKEIDGEDFKE